jgi:hypothetical protein
MRALIDRSQTVLEESAEALRGALRLQAPGQEGQPQAPGPG